MTPTEARARWAEMSHKERSAMAKEAPRVSGPWEKCHGVDWVREWHGEFAGSVRLDGRGKLWACTSAGRKAFDTDEAETAKAWVDARLIADGWVLE
jgi:hypothetical protein